MDDKLCVPESKLVESLSEPKSNVHNDCVSHSRSSAPKQIISTNEPSTSASEIEVERDKQFVLTLLNGVGYCFSANDYMKIRKEHRICGSFMGANHLKGYTRKNEKLPVEFNAYETQLMLDEKIAILVSKRRAFEKGVSKKVEEELLTQFENRIIEQGKALNEKKIEETLKNITKVMAGKRKKLLSSGIPEKDIKLTENEVIEEMKSNIKFDRKNAQLEIPNQCLYDHKADLVNFKLEDRLGYKIFYDIWKKGKVYVTLGGNFGGNFLVYPGDPLAYHASHIVHVLETPKIHPLDLIAKCRLTVTVNKICILAYVNPKNDDIRYQTIQWEGSKDKLNLLNVKQNNSDTEGSDDL